MIKRDDVSLDSWLIAGGRSESPGEPLNVSIVPASNFIIGAGPVYAREDGTATWRALEDVLGGMEHGRALVFSSGMAAVTAVFSRVDVGAHILLPADCYQGVVGLAEDGRRQGRWTFETLPIDDTEAWIAALPTADLIWLESPSNPLLTIGDLPAICAATRKPGAVVVVDNTFATSINQQPLSFGADISLHSATKYIGGHSDLLAGVLILRDGDLFAELQHARSSGGATPGALEAYLALRGVRTMAIRLERSQATALALAKRLAAHPQVTRVRYPGLEADPHHDVASRTLAGFGSILSFELEGGADAGDRFCQNVGLVTHATSLGGVETTVERRAGNVGQEHLPPSLLRLSVGCEAVEDLWADLFAALSTLEE